MDNKHLIAFAAIFALVTACGQQAEQQAEQKVETAVEQPTAISSNDGMVLPVTTSSDAARAQYMAGWADFANARFATANSKFLEAVSSDPSFAMAHLMAALSSVSSESFTANLRKASENMEMATEGEQLLIKSWEQAFNADAKGVIESRLKVTELHPDSPRAWVFLGNAYGNVNDSAQARAAFTKAIEADSGFVPAHTGLGNSLMNQDPKDFAMAEQHFKQAVAITPSEPNPHDLLGDVHRAQNNLDEAYGDYTKAAELAPDLGSGLQQRGHVSSFLGNYDQARADYARAAELEDARGVNGGFFLIYHAFVNVYEGNPGAAIAELRALAAGADAAYTDAVIDLQVNALSNASLFATEYGDSEAAMATIAEAAALMRQQAKDIGTDKVVDAQEATIAYMEGLLAARTGDTAGVAAKAAEFEQHAASSTNPRKLERMHEILGTAAYYQNDFAAAVEHLSAGDNQGNMYNKYHLAQANKAAGNADEAARLFAELAVYNFNSPGFALFRKIILESATVN